MKLPTLVVVALLALSSVAFAQGISSSVKPSESTATTGPAQAQPGTAEPLFSGRSVRRDGPSKSPADLSNPDESTRICSNCDD